MLTATELQSGPIQVVDYRCSAGPDAKPFTELHQGYSVSYVRKGSFGYRVHGESYELVAGSVLVGHPGDEYMCTHEHHVCGDECLAFHLSPGFVDLIGGDTDTWRTGGLPPLPELMVLGELAQAAAEGHSDAGLDEVGLWFASRFVEVVSGRRPTPQLAAARDRQRAVNDCLERLRDATTSVRATTSMRQVAITTTPGFASLWLIPRLARFTASHPSVDVRISATLELLDLARSRIDVSVRLSLISQGVGSPLFEETVLPVCAPQLLKNRALPLKKPADLVKHTLLVTDTPQGQPLTIDWEPWFKIMGLPEIRMKNTLRFSQYSDVVAAAVAGQGVAIGRLPLLDEMLQGGRLVAPFSGAASRLGYFVNVSPRAAGNADAQDFVRWLMSEAELTKAVQPAKSL